MLPGDAGVLWGRGRSPGRAHCTRLVIHPNDEKLPERKLMRRSCRNRRERETETEREKRTLKEITFRRKKRVSWTNRRFRGATGSPSYTRPRQWAHTNGCQANEKVKFMEEGSVEPEMEALHTERAIKRLQYSHHPLHHSGASQGSVVRGTVTQQITSKTQREQTLGTETETNASHWSCFGPFLFINNMSKHFLNCWCHV